MTEKSQKLGMQLSGNGTENIVPVELRLPQEDCIETSPIGLRPHNNDAIPPDNYEVFRSDNEYAARELSNTEQEIFFGRPYDELQKMHGYLSFTGEDDSTQQLPWLSQTASEEPYQE